ncbi:MAG: glycoside hydrolase family 31 protein [Prevotellaceae bacterium]|nr:glycoside hydrolase family 31 protein [Prevotellaceae bacterium]
MKRNIAYLLFLLCALSAKADKLPEIQFVTPSVVRIQWSEAGNTSGNNTGICVYVPQHVNVKKKETSDKIVYRSSELTVELDKSSTALSFYDKNGKLLLSENPAEPRGHSPVVKERLVYDDNSARIEETANGKVTVKDIIRRDTVGVSHSFFVNFIFSGRQALYGLGSHMEDYMNLLGKTQYLTQHNLKAFVPVLISSKGYGLLFDAGCAMKFSSERMGSDRYSGSMTLDAAQSLDYYFMAGTTMADVVGDYRFLTGRVSLPPRYVFGYIQSKERYMSSDDIIGTLREYRRRHIPIDMIVQDWNYWPQGWGYLKMNRKYYPSPKALADSVHAMNAKLMISIWANPQGCPQEEDFRQRGYMLENSVYDAFNPDARKLYWEYVNDEFFSQGFDAWWCDSSEPLDGDWNRMPEPQNGVAYGWGDHERRWRLNKEVLGNTLGEERSSLYSLYHTKGIYENQRSVTEEKRVVNLTRSSYAGQQQYGTIVWNGDTHASWDSFKQQIPSGLNYMATGNPYWTVDVGAFFTRADSRWFYKGEFPEGNKDNAYREFYTRMFQWATFLLILRSHGTDTAREIWNFGEPGTPYYESILKMIRLRYSLLPYIYTMAAMQTFGNFTMARPLAFDFPEDENVFDLKDEYMFGSILVCPVTDSGVTKRMVYLPSSSEGTVWFDYWTGVAHHGGKWIEADAAIDKLPLFVRCGSVIPTIAPIEHTGEQAGKPLTVNVYPGKDAEFTLYNDSGDGYRYEKGECSMTKITWDDKKRTLVIHKSEGSFSHAPAEQDFIVRTPEHERTVRYVGDKITVKL